MIETEIQYKVTKERLVQFKKDLSKCDDTPIGRLMSNAIQSEIEIFEKDIAEYENNKI